MKHLACLSALFLLFAVPALARAADGYVTANVSLRAGPDIGYPLIDVIPAGDSVDIYGCTDGWVWCDVGYRDERGWVAGSYIEFSDQGGYRALPRYGVQVGIPIVTFVITRYWSDHYRHRPFYRDRHVWYARPLPHRRPPPPPHRPWHRSGTPPWAQTAHPGTRRDAGPDKRPRDDGFHPNSEGRPADGRRTAPHTGVGETHRPAAQPRQQPSRIRPQTRSATQPPRAHPSPAVRPAPSKDHRRDKPAPKAHEEHDG